MFHILEATEDLKSVYLLGRLTVNSKTYCALTDQLLSVIYIDLSSASLIGRGEVILNR